MSAPADVRPDAGIPHIRRSSMRSFGASRRRKSDMSMAEPEWFRYVEWDYSDPSFPVMKGLRKDTPPELVKKFEEDQKAFRRAREQGIIF